MLCHPLDLSFATTRPRSFVADLRHRSTICPDSLNIQQSFSKISIHLHFADKILPASNLSAYDRGYWLSLMQIVDTILQRLFYLLLKIRLLVSATQTSNRPASTAAIMDNRVRQVLCISVMIQKIISLAYLLQSFNCFACSCSSL